MVHAGSRQARASPDPKCKMFRFDLEDEASIEAAARSVFSEGLPDLVIVATGVLHSAALWPEKSLKALDAAALRDVLAVNAIGPALVAKHILPHLSQEGKSVFGVLSARVGSISDNRLGGWHAYRSSKAALNMLVRNFAIELKRTHPDALCVALHPGTVDTALSRPFQTGLRADHLFSPDVSAHHLLSVIDALTPDQSGRLFAWDGREILG
jgi:NAD(P)-dependent dehydrogenase (short-subunit alcohol dehydrogenase family)